MATLPRVDLRHLSHWPSQWNRLHLPHTYPYVLLQGSWSSSCTWNSARQPRDANVPNGSLDYDEQMVHLTLRHSYLHQSRHRDSTTASLQQWSSGGSVDIWLFNAARHPTANVTHRHSYLHQTQPRHIVIPLQASAQWLAANLELTFSHFMKMYFKAISLLFDLNRSKLNWYWNKMNSTWNITSVVALHGAGMKLWKDNKSDYAS